MIHSAHPYGGTVDRTVELAALRRLNTCTREILHADHVLWRSTACRIGLVSFIQIATDSAILQRDCFRFAYTSILYTYLGMYVYVCVRI